MSFPIHVEAQNGHYTASLVGMPKLSVVKATRAAAIAALEKELHHRVAQGEFLSLEIESIGVTATAGAFVDDPTLDDIVEEAYRLRDADRDSL